MSIAAQNERGSLSASALVWGMMLVLTPAGLALTPAGMAQTMAHPVTSGQAAPRRRRARRRRQRWRRKRLPAM